jgi:hypothetical protein
MAERVFLSKEERLFQSETSDLPKALFSAESRLFLTEEQMQRNRGP